MVFFLINPVESFHPCETDYSLAIHLRRIHYGTPRKNWRSLHPMCARPESGEFDPWGPCLLSALSTEPQLPGSDSMSPCTMSLKIDSWVYHGNAITMPSTRSLSQHYCRNHFITPLKRMAPSELQKKNVGCSNI